MLALVLWSLVGSSAAPPGQADSKYIRCAVCEALVESLHNRTSLFRTEADAQGAVDEACSEQGEAGAWMGFYDLVETEDRLELVRQPEDGPCGTECHAIALACRGLLEEGWESELGEALYASAGTSAGKGKDGRKGAQLDQLKRTVCREYSTACRKPPPPLDRARPAGPRFRPFTEEERAQRIEQLGASPPSGLLSENDLLRRFGLDGKLPHGPGLEHNAAFADNS